MTNKTAHLISHTHWDREWYMPYEYHHTLLAELMNDLLRILEEDDSFRSFHLDGQTIIIEDYLQIHPEKREVLEKYIREGRIIIGPWYVLQDEFLTSSEANVRNLLIGHQDAAYYGVISKLGYFPDSFGNMGQAPQMLKQADIDTAVFGRGVKPTGFDNMVGETTAPAMNLHIQKCTGPLRTVRPCWDCYLPTGTTTGWKCRQIQKKRKPIGSNGLAMPVNTLLRQSFYS